MINCIKEKITYDNKEYKLMLVTKDFIYYGITEESDENRNVVMIRKNNNEVVSDNYFAYNELFSYLEEIQEGKYKKSIDYFYLSEECKEYISNIKD